MDSKIAEFLIEKYQVRTIVEVPDIIYIGTAIGIEIEKSKLDTFKNLMIDDKLFNVILYTPDCLNISRMMNNINSDNLININSGLFLINECTVSIAESVEPGYYSVKLLNDGAIEDLRRILISLELEFGN